MKQLTMSYGLTLQKRAYYEARIIGTKNGIEFDSKGMTFIGKPNEVERKQLIQYYNTVKYLI